MEKRRINHENRHSAFPYHQTNLSPTFVYITLQEIQIYETLLTGIS